MAESFQRALNLVVQTLGRLEGVAADEDVSGIATWGEGLLEVVDGIRATVEVPSDLQLQVHWDQFLNLSTELGRAARLVPETLDLAPLVELETHLVSEIDAISATV
jgi:hypothetical protein